MKGAALLALLAVAGCSNDDLRLERRAANERHLVALHRRRPHMSQTRSLADTPRSALVRECFAIRRDIIRMELCAVLRESPPCIMLGIFSPAMHCELVEEYSRGNGGRLPFAIGKRRESLLPWP